MPTHRLLYEVYASPARQVRISRDLTAGTSPRERERPRFKVSNDRYRRRVDSPTLYPLYTLGAHRWTSLNNTAPLVRPVLSTSRAVRMRGDATRAEYRGVLDHHKVGMREL